MKKRKPVSIEEIPTHPRGLGRHSPNEQLFQEVLRLNGSAIPIEFDTVHEALKWAVVNRSRNARAKTLGIKVIQRGQTIYLQRR